MSPRLARKQQVLLIDRKGAHAHKICCAMVFGRKNCARDGGRLARERGVLQQAARMHHTQDLGLLRHV